ncbi:MAG: cyclic pyranopterin monophosphate synthase MoaC [Planctomycetota bacterium]|jgi:cyclic pyranopterin phosphate synthase
MNDEGGMVDVGDKDITVRVAKACGTINLGEEAFKVMKNGTCIKGDVFATAKIAAIQAVKSTASVIPLCHSILIDAIDIDFVLNEEENTVCVTVTVKSTGKTGVEMEALTGAGIACLTIYDMLKYTGKAIIITQIKLLEKTGGKSGDYKRCD